MKQPKTKKDWKTLAEARGRMLDEKVPASPLTFDNLTICFSAKTVTIGGRTIDMSGGPDCLAIPITNDKWLLAPAGWVPMVTRWDG